MKSKHKYLVGEEVNGLIIISQEIDTKYNYKTYMVQSIRYPEAPKYMVYETSLVKGKGDSYLPGCGRVFEGNSLYSKKEYRKYIVDIEQAKTISPNHSKKILMQCPECHKQKHITPHTLLKQGFSCSTCSKNTSYPELFMLSYFEIMNIEFEYQVRFDDFNKYIFDFKIELNNNIYLIETHGIAHYNSNHNWYKSTHDSDIAKRKYCKENNIKLIELDCSRSNFDFISKSIEDNDILPNILSMNKKDILKDIESNKRYPVKDIIKLYKHGKSTYYIANKYNVSNVTVSNILKKNGIKIQSYNQRLDKKVKCTTSGKIFNSVAEASKYYNVARSSIRKSCNDNTKSAGKHPNTKEKLYWEFIATN